MIPRSVRRQFVAFAALVVLLLPAAVPASAQTWQMDVPSVVLRGVGFDVAVTVEGDTLAADAFVVRTRSGEFAVEADDDGALSAAGVTLSGDDLEVQLVRQGAVVTSAETRSLPGWLSIMPPLLAIAIALIFKRVVPSLFLGIWLGAMLVVGISIEGAFRGLMNTFQVYVLSALADADHASIILFSFMIGGMVGIISKNGGMQGVVNRITGWARSPRRGQVATSFLGIAIFFDDYANTLVVGNTMRSVTDRLNVSREKLAYLVDSTAAPVACLAFVTTWIGFEVGLIGQAVDQLPRLNLSAYSVFLSSIPYSFYPLLAIFFVFAVSISRRDYGPMYQAELRARSTGKVLGDNAQVDEAAMEGKETAPKEGKPHRMINAILPVVVLVGGVLGGLYLTGMGPDKSLREIIGDANSYKALMWGSLLGVMTAALLSVGQRILTIDEVVESWYAGLKAMLFAMIILVLAWSLSEITEVLHTAEYLTTILGEALNPGFVPAIVFILSAATAFATGSSWGTMGIIMPLVLPLAWAVMLANGMADAEHYHILYSTVSCVLAGAVWGDHCSPISDTTILSSMASGCDHIEHVRTQLPYALTVGAVAVVVGTIPTGFGFPWYISLVAGGLILYGVLHFLGERADDAAQAA